MEAAPSADLHRPSAAQMRYGERERPPLLPRRARISQTRRITRSASLRGDRCCGRLPALPALHVARIAEDTGCPSAVGAGLRCTSQPIKAAIWFAVAPCYVKVTRGRVFLLRSLLGALAEGSLRTTVLSEAPRGGAIYSYRRSTAFLSRLGADEARHHRGLPSAEQLARARCCFRCAICSFRASAAPRVEDASLMQFATSCTFTGRTPAHLKFDDFFGPLLATRRTNPSEMREMPIATIAMKR